MIRKTIIIIMAVMMMVMTGCQVQEEIEPSEETQNPIPQNIKIVSKTPTSIQIGWDKISKATSYVIYSSNDGITFDETPLGTSDTNSYNIDIPSIANGGCIYCRVTSIVNGAESEPGKTIKAYTSLDTPDIIVEGDTVDYRICYIKWEPVTNATSYKIYRADLLNTTFVILDYAEQSASTVTYKNVDLASGNTYYYKVIACKNTETYSKDSDIESYICKLGTVSGINIVDGLTDRIIINWTPNPNVDGYVIYSSSYEYGTYGQVTEITNNQIGSYSHS